MALTEISADHDAAPDTRRILLDVTGMTCRMCSSHIANQLNKVDGVRASVDVTSKIATIDASLSIDVADLCLVVEKAGFGATEHVGSVAEALAPKPTHPQGPARQLAELVALFLNWLGIRRR